MSDGGQLHAYPIAYVEWTDSGIVAGGWEDRGAVLERVKHTELLAAAGLLIENTAEGITLCAGYNPRIDDVVSCIAIPRSQIVRLQAWAPWVEHPPAEPSTERQVLSP